MTQQTVIETEFGYIKLMLMELIIERDRVNAKERGDTIDSSFSALSLIVSRANAMNWNSNPIRRLDVSN